MAGTSGKDEGDCGWLAALDISRPIHESRTLDEVPKDVRRALGERFSSGELQMQQLIAAEMHACHPSVRCAEVAHTIVPGVPVCSVEIGETERSLTLCVEARLVGDFTGA